MPAEFRSSLLGEWADDAPLDTTSDPYCLATVKRFRSLAPMAHALRKPIFRLTVADGAIGAHSAAVREAYVDFEALRDRSDQNLIRTPNRTL